MKDLLGDFLGMDWKSFALLALGVVGFSISAFVIWKNRDTKDLEWFLGIAGLAIAAAVGTLGTLQGIDSAREMRLLQGKADVAEQAVADARRAADGAKQDAANAIATAKQEAADLKHSITRRDLELRALRVDGLDDFRGTPVIIWHEPGEEPSQVAAELKHKLSSAGWDVREVTGIEGRLNPGISIVAVPKTAKEAANALVAVLATAGVRAKVHPAPAPSDEVSRILIGPSERLNPPHVERESGNEASENLLLLPASKPGGAPRVVPMTLDDTIAPPHKKAGEPDGIR